MKKPFNLVVLCAFFLIGCTLRTWTSGAKPIAPTVNNVPQPQIETPKEKASDFPSPSATKAYQEQKSNLPAHMYVCFPLRKELCTNTGCSIEELLSNFTLVNTQPNTVSRCDRNGCDTYDTQNSVSGIYLNAQPANASGWFIKLQTPPTIDNESALDYVEVVTQFTSALVYHGRCFESDSLEIQP